jgi:two-component system sensor histidine kinase/response regulator
VTTLTPGDGGSTSVLEKELLQIKEKPEERRVLLVDDEEDILFALSEYLVSKGYSTETARDSRQALSLIHESKFSAVVSDLRMPGMSGVGLLEEVLDVDPETVFIIMTGYATVQSAVEALRKGAYDYIVKPFSLHDLEKTVRLGLEKRKLARENVELSHLMKKLIEIDQIKTNVISTVSHEFRTPLTSLKGYLGILMPAVEQATDMKSPERTWLKGMKVNVDRLETLILNLLVMTEVRAGDLLIAEENVAVNEVITGAIDALDPVIKSKGVDIVFDGDGEPRIEGDVEKLGVVMRNLIENAVKFNMDSGSVTIGVTRSTNPGGVTVRITDTGIGIPSEKIKFIFDTFTQADMSHTRRFAGAGLGLPVAKAIVEAHGGSIGVDSSPGKGSTFSIWLPERKGARSEHA